MRQADQVPAITGAALGILRRAFHELAEGALSPADQTKIARAIAAVPGVEDWHNLRPRFSGLTAFLDVHIQVDPSLRVEESRAIASQVEGAVRAALGGQTSVVVHVEPRSASDEPSLHRSGGRLDPPPARIAPLGCSATNAPTCPRRRRQRSG
ncbi:MAG: cation diffusion facilitator family transporter [Candidatus Bipolaricaulaceae bacterium]